ncbi:MAG: M1 family aminopeptidase, partial [Thermoanaerobaculia bacterium]
MRSSRRQHVVVWIVAVGVSSLLSPVLAAAEEPTRFAADRPLDCLHIKLTLDVEVEQKHVDATAQLELVALRQVSTITLDAQELDTHAVGLSRNGGPASSADYTNDGKQIEIQLAEPLAAGEKVTVIVEYTVDKPTNGLHFFGPTEDEPDVPPVVWSQGESVYNSYWFPCFDNPNERQTTELFVTTRSGFQVSSNGRLVSRTEDQAAGTVTYHWLQDKPHVAYLVSLIVGEFHIETETWRGKPVEYWVHPRFEERIARSFRNTTRMLDFFSDSIGVEYPWDRYAQICCEGFGGGMENTAATTLGNRALHDARSFIDNDSDGLIAHELAHQWWGDLLTCRDWSHLWLNEGFASYFEALWEEYDLGPDEFAYNMFRKAARARSGGTKRPIVDRAYSHSRSMFDSRAYPKGAWVLHMVRRRLGDDLFWQAIKRYATDYAYKTVETVDLRKTIESVTGRSFERFFYDWTERPGHPELSASFKWLNDQKLASVTLKQTQKSSAFHFPLKLEFTFAEDTAPVILTHNVTEKEQTFYHPLPEAPRLVRVDPDQSILMELKETKGHDLWKAQLLEDASPVARIRAARHFEKSRRDSDHTLLAEALDSESFWAVKKEIAVSLGEVGGETARDALIAGLGFEDPKARRACVEALASFEGDEAAIDAVKRLAVDGDASYYVEAAAIETFGSLKPDGAVEILKQALRRVSDRERLRSAALTS